MNNKRFLIFSIILFFFIAFGNAHDITVPKTAYFGLPQYGTYINFDSDITFDEIYRENNYWYFDGYGFQIQNANMTISQFFENDELIFTVSGSSGTISTTIINVGDRGKPIKVYGADNWTWDPSGSITISVAHVSSRIIGITFSKGTSGSYNVRVHVSKNFFSYSGAIVNILGENKSTDVFGDAHFSVPYGVHTITAFCEDQKQIKEGILINADKVIGFNFDIPAKIDRSIYILFGIPLGIVLIFVVIMLFLRGKK